jgi:non-specific protein-tyrosine kinase
MELTPFRLRRYIRRWLTFALVGLILGGAAAYAASKSMTPEYTAHASVVVQSANNVQSGASFTQTANQAANTVAALITQRPVLDAVRDELQLRYTGNELWDRVTASAQPDTSLVEVGVTDPSPQEAARIANAIIRRFVVDTEKQTRQRGDQVAGELAARIRSLRGQADEAAITALTAQYANVVSQQAQALGNVAVASTAAVPTSPVTPRTLLNTAIGALLGLLLGVGFAALRQYVDQGVHTADDVAERLDAPVLATVPRLRGREGAEASSDSSVDEAYRMLRASILFSAMGKPATSILVTSMKAGEGKTQTASSLARLIAAAGQRVLLIDADMRRPRLHEVFDERLHNGLSEYLLHFGADASHQGDEHLRSVSENLSLLTAGTPPPNPAELLSGPYMPEFMRSLERAFDVVIVDTPPIGAVTDAISLAPLTSLAVIVIEAGRTNARDAARGLALLKSTGATVGGVVLNKVKDRALETYQYAYYGTTVPENGAVADAQDGERLSDAAPETSRSA